ncbi:MAG: response regulator [Burkholderiales bacterium]|nr:response regulator [Burkholderiales bacterium]MDE2454737.1 response regulator [Burkholderiales bacterium]
MTSKGKILVVDDDRLVLATLVHGLAEAGYEVVDADNGDDAILLARQQRPELALLDIRMEGKSGFDVAEYLRDVCRIPFMFLSAFSDAATVAQVEALGAVAYMVKPLDVGQIVPTVDAAFARLHAGAPAAAPALAPASAAAAASVALGDPLPMAVGVLMHRHSLTRIAALERLRRMAAEQGVSEAAQAERLLAALEELART